VIGWVWYPAFICSPIHPIPWSVHPIHGLSPDRPSPTIRGENEGFLTLNVLVIFTAHKAPWIPLWWMEFSDAAWQIHSMVCPLTDHPRPSEEKMRDFWHLCFSYFHGS
jgi:hypothetical protein